MLREADELAAVVRAAGVRAAAGEVVVDVVGGDEVRVREEDLRVGHRLVREEDDEGRALLVEDRAQGEVDLGETGGAAVAVEGAAELYV